MYAPNDFRCSTWVIRTRRARTRAWEVHARAVPSAPICTLLPARVLPCCLPTAWRLAIFDDACFQLIALEVRPYQTQRAHRVGIHVTNAPALTRHPPMNLTSVNNTLIDAMPGHAEAKALLALPAPTERDNDRVRVFDNGLVITIARGGRQTGGDVWKGAFALQRFLSANPGLVACQRVCELGGGTGFLAMSAHLLGTAHCVLTDKFLTLSSYMAHAYPNPRKRFLMTSLALAHLSSQAQCARERRATPDDDWDI